MFTLVVNLGQIIVEKESKMKVRPFYSDSHITEYSLLVPGVDHFSPELCKIGHLLVLL